MRCRMEIQTTEEIIDNLETIEYVLFDNEGEYIPNYWHHWEVKPKEMLDAINNSRSFKEKKWVAIENILGRLRYARDNGIDDYPFIISHIDNIIGELIDRK